MGGYWKGGRERNAEPAIPTPINRVRNWTQNLGPEADLEPGYVTMVRQVLFLDIDLLSQ